MTDPDSRHIKSNLVYVQGYNAQAVGDEGRLWWPPRSQTAMITAAIAELDQAGAADRPQIALADAQILERAAFGPGDRRHAVCAAGG
ncbi:MAG: hypothetical protein WBP81_04430 [Solirubrobacteraceae bacterium]